MIVISRLSGPLRLSFSGGTGVSANKWEKITFNCGAILACMGVTISTYSLTKLAAASSRHR